MHDTLLGTQPAQLRVVCQGASKGAEVGNNVDDVSADDEVVQRLTG